ncbi:cyclase family protein [Asanoa sp. WMMD1127]|uniref:cyclase family protein n=1 Tax=Asanoa sp. WMMD1127 TaxID=3016107 RepID=UPI0024165FE8|nr:cyclase family protein [Asanoa sp. WMMD1127]MDG4826780.1 cyclase family protein [Asanoa sp. WMMD1127]
MVVVADLLAGLASGAVRVVDLTNPLSSRTPTLRLPEPFANLDDFSLEQVSAYDPPGPFWKHHNIRTGEHIGTHLDAPVHWITGRDGHDVSQIPPDRLVGPAAVMDFSAAAAEDPDFLLEISHVKSWIDAHGELAPGTWLLFRTGWDRFAHDQALFLNDSRTPGISASCAEWLATDTPISGFGVETVGIDAGSAGGFDPPFPAHFHLLGNDKYGLTSLQNLASLPPTGALLVVAPLPIVGGTGSPTRALALVDGR